MQHILQDSSRNLVPTAVQDSLGRGLSRTWVFEHNGLCVRGHPDGHHTDHAITVEPVAILLVADSVAPRAIQKKGACNTLGNVPTIFPGSIQ
jgi:hypothetical protein